MRVVNLVATFGGALAVALSAGSAARAMTIVAGSGSLGYESGSAAAASFVEPLGLAIAPDGSTIVADAGAQRIRRIGADGVVSTLAGSGALARDGLGVPGGYADGPANAARFDHPAAVAVDADGSVVVADTRNRCLRRIRNGIVTTIAGRPGSVGSADGPVTQATFYAPRGVAFGGDETLYMADWANGIRAIAHGIVRTIATPSALGKNVTAIAFAPGGGGTLLATNGTQTVTVPLKTGVERLWSANPSDRNAYGGTALMEGGGPATSPSALAAYGPGEFVASDARNSRVAYLHDAFTAPLIDSADAKLAQPSGIAVRADGRVIVADTANRRILAFEPPDRRFQTQASDITERSSDAFRIALIGDSYVYYDTWWDQSTPGIVERALTLDEPSQFKGRRIETIAIRLGSMDGLREYVHEVLASGIVDAVVLQVDPNMAYTSYGVPYWSDLSLSVSRWGSQMSSSLAAMSSDLARAHVAFAVDTTPTANDVGPLERIASIEAEGGIEANIDLAGSRAVLPGLVERAGIRCHGDATPDFIAAERLSPHVALFEPFDLHFAARGRDVAARRIVSLIRECVAREIR